MTNIPSTASLYIKPTKRQILSPKTMITTTNNVSSETKPSDTDEATSQPSKTPNNNDTVNEHTYDGQQQQQQQQQQPRQKSGNLQSALLNFEGSTAVNSLSDVAGFTMSGNRDRGLTMGSEMGLISIGPGRDRALTFGSELGLPGVVVGGGRERSLTFGSETFEFSFNQDGGNSMSQYGSFLEQDHPPQSITFDGGGGDDKNNTESNATATVSSPSSYYNTEDGSSSQGGGGAGKQPHPSLLSRRDHDESHESQIPSDDPKTTTTNDDGMDHDGTDDAPNNVAANAPATTESVGSFGSAGGFLTGMYGHGGNNNNNAVGVPWAGAGGVAHTPPSAYGTSYEARHFGKRMRSGSVSGRLRSASDLEDKGLIDRSQKEILKDLIISGDETLHEALDKYEGGDSSRLENMIKSGVLLNRKANDIDLLDDLDLDFLTVNDIDNNCDNELPQCQPLAQDRLGLPLGITRSKSIPIPKNPYLQHDVFGNNMDTCHNGLSKVRAMSNESQNPAHLVPSSSYEDDGVGDLEFNGDFSGTIDDETMETEVRAGGGGRRRSVGSDSTATYRLRSGTFGSLDINPPGALDRWDNSGGGNGNGVIVPGEISFQNQKGSNSGNNDVSYNDGSSNAPTVISMSGMYPVMNGESKSSKKGKPLLNSVNYAKRDKIPKEKRTKSPKPPKEKKKTEGKPKVKKESKKKDTTPRTPKRSGKTNTPSSSERTTSKDDEPPSPPKEVPSGLGLPRSMSDPNLSVATDADGLLHVERPEGWVGAYSPESRKMRIERFLAKRNKRVWTKKVKYDVRKNFADSRLRVKGRFVKKEDELLMRDLLSLT